MKKILVTGGAGYIGSHTILLLLQAGFEVIVIDNLCNSSDVSLSRVEQIAGRSITFVKGDIRDSALLKHIFSIHSVHAVLHFAGLKAVSESVEQPLLYYDNNVNGSCALLQAMANAAVFNLVFSSSATVYGLVSEMPISEACRVDGPTNPYGRTKLVVEDMLQELAFSDKRWHIAILRYFNPVGAHESGLIGENPKGVPNNLVPYIAKVASGQLAELPVFGNDYATKDGTGVRDYIHVMDLAEGHLSALNTLQSVVGINVWNLGTGYGYSVLEVIQAFERACKKSIPYRIFPRRSGDIAICYSDPSKASRELGWHARRGLDCMMEDVWRWHSTHPYGFD